MANITIVLIETVRKMRAAQCAYFKRKTQENLIEAKQLEQEVDRQLKQWPEAREVAG